LAHDQVKPLVVAIVAGAPVYYHAPLYRRLAADPRIELTVIFASDRGARRPVRSGYATDVEFGVDASSGYRSVFLRRAPLNPRRDRGVLSLVDPDVVVELARVRPDVLMLHGHHTLTHLLALAYQKLRRRPILLRVEKKRETYTSWRKRARAIVLKILFSGTYGLFIGSENRQWLEQMGVPAKRLFSTPYAVDNVALRAAARRLQPCQKAVQERFGIFAPPVILTVSSLAPVKQPLHLLEAYRRVRSRARCSLLVVGVGPCEDAMRKYVDDYRVRDVIFAGFLPQPRVAEAYSAADVFVLPSSAETWGLVVNEAMNFGLPVVASDRVGSASDLVLDGETGFIVPFDDVGALADAMHRLVAFPELRAGLGRAGRSRVAAWNYGATFTGLLEALAVAAGAERWTALTSALGSPPRRTHAAGRPHACE